MKTITALSLMLWLLTATAAAQSKIGYVDIDRVTNKAKSVNSTFSKIGEKVNKLQSDIDGKTEKIKRLREDVQKSEGVLAKEELDKKRKEVNQLMNEVDDLSLQGRRELQRVDDTFLSPLLKKIVYAIQDVAKEKELDIVLRGESVLYGRDTVDITDDVIKHLNMEDLGSTASVSEKKTEGSERRPGETGRPASAGSEGAPEPSPTPAEPERKSPAPPKAKATKPAGTARPVDRQPD
jgi:outer membrane protein